MTAATFRPLGRWPHKDTYPRRGQYTFKAAWSDTLVLLDRELDHLGARDVVIQADFREDDIRLDGMPRSNARVPQHPGVIVSFESTQGPLQYATDAHEWWQHNVRGIALGLGALRAVDRYGITRAGEQYKGWRQLTAGNGGPTTAEEAIDLVVRVAEIDPTTLGDSVLALESAWKLARRKAHPDAGGTAERFAAVMEAGQILGLRVRS